MVWTVLHSRAPARCGCTERDAALPTACAVPTAPTAPTVPTSSFGRAPAVAGRVLLVVDPQPLRLVGAGADGVPGVGGRHHVPLARPGRRDVPDVPDDGDPADVLAGRQRVDDQLGRLGVLHRRWRVGGAREAAEA